MSNNSETPKMNRDMRCGDVWNNGFIIAMIVALIMGLVAVAVALPLTIQPQHPAMRKAMLKRDRSACAAGEDWESETQLCAPRFHAPLAFEGSIMDGAHTACNASFYHMMCGTWLRQHTNENRAFSYAHRRIVSRLVRMVTERQGPLKRFYDSCMARGTDASHHETFLVFKHLIARIVEPIRSHADLPKAFGTLARMGYTHPFALSIEKHPLEPRVIPLFMYDNFPEDVLNEQSIFQVLFGSRSVTNYNMQQEQNMILSVLSISRAMREVRLFRLDQVDDFKSYVLDWLPRHVMPWSDLSTTWQWDRYFQTMAGPGFRLASNESVWVPDVRYLKRLTTEIIPRFGIPEWKAWLTFSILFNGHQLNPDLPDNVYFKQHDRNGPMGSGHHLASRIRRANGNVSCIVITQHMLPGLIAEQYLETYMPNRAADRADVRVLVEHLRFALRNVVRNTNWLSLEDRTILETKLNKTLVRIVEPDVWQSEPFAQSISSDCYDHNLNLVRAYRVERNLGMWHAAAYEKPAWDRNALATFASPLTSVNAYYSGTSNSITILAGLMQHPFYSADYGKVSKYAIMGSVIGHELSHMFDHHGLYWDGQGNYHPNGIISPEGMRRFYNASDCIIEQYGPAPAGCESEDVSYGNNTSGEDLADLTGIKTALNALIQAEPSLTLGDRQHFFMVLAQAFCETYDQEQLCDSVRNDVHAIAEFRIDRTFRNMVAFHETFQCHPGHEMWRNASDVCIVY